MLFCRQKEYTGDYTKSYRCYCYKSREGPKVVILLIINIKKNNDDPPRKEEALQNQVVGSVTRVVAATTIIIFVTMSSLGLHRRLDQNDTQQRLSSSTSSSSSEYSIREGIEVEQEVTNNILVPFPVSQNFTGPDCDRLTKRATLCLDGLESSKQFSSR